jgi:hypothetical protein
MGRKHRQIRRHAAHNAGQTVGWRMARRQRSRRSLQNTSLDVADRFEADVVQAHEFAVRHPTQIAQAAVAGIDPGTSAPQA